MTSDANEPPASAKRLVLDANILVRAVLGSRVLERLAEFRGAAEFLTAAEAFDDAETHLPTILRRRGLPDEAVALALEQLTRLRGIVTVVPAAAYAHLEGPARKRLAGRDEEDWPFVALALLLDCPVWTEDRDFFGSGVATWTTARIHLFFEEG